MSETPVWWVLRVPHHWHPLLEPPPPASLRYQHYSQLLHQPRALDSGNLSPVEVQVDDFESPSAFLIHLCTKDIFKRESKTTGTGRNSRDRLTRILVLSFSGVWAGLGDSF